MLALDKSFSLFGSNFVDRQESFYQMIDFIGFESAKWAKYQFYDFNCVNGDKLYFFQNLVILWQKSWQKFYITHY